MRYAAVVAASVAVTGIFVITRDGRSEDAPAIRAAAAQTVPARLAQQQPAAARGQTGQEDFRWSGRLARGREIEIRGIVGDVRAEVASGDEVEVIGRRSGDDAGRVRIEVVEDSDGMVICAVYPNTGDWNGDSDRRDRRSQDPCQGGRDGGGEIDAEDARVDFTVRVPAGVRFASAIVAGDVYATSLRSDVDVTTVSGDVRVSTTGTARATTVSGDVEATFAQTGEDMEFASVSGDVILRLAGDVGARVQANTLSGDIESDFDLRIRPGGHDDEDEDEDDDGGFHVNVQIGTQATGTIGRGGPELSVNTVSGDIHLLRSR